MTGGAPRAAALAVGAAGALAVAALAATVALRTGYPYPLEWQEGGMLEHARRVAAGAPLYVAPGLDFAPFPYPPLFHGLGALFLGLLGDGLPALRAVSVLSLGVLLALLAREGARAGAAVPSRDAGTPGRRAVPALAAAGTLAAGAGWGGDFLDLARVDALALALALGAVLAARASRGPTGAAAAGALGAAAVLAKQTALGPVALLLLPLARRGPRSALAFGLTLTALLGGWLALADARSGGWASFTVLELLRGSPWHGPAVLGFWREAALALGLLGAGVALARPRIDGFVAAAAVGLVVAAWVGRAHEGGYENTRLPAVLAAALLAGPAVAAALAACRAAPLALVAAGLVTLTVAGGDPRARVPDAADRAALERALDDLRALPAPAFVPDAPDLARRAGHPPAVHAMAVVDLLKSGEDEVAAAFVQQLEAALRAQAFGAVVLDAPWDLPALEQAYAPGGTLEVPRPRSGAPRVPRLVYLPR